jgi:hypothetical protein
MMALQIILEGRELYRMHLFDMTKQAKFKQKQNKQQVSVVIVYFHMADPASSSGEGCGKPVATTLTTTSSAFIQLCLTSSGKSWGPRALSRKATSTTVKFCRNIQHGF